MFRRKGKSSDFSDEIKSHIQLEAERLREQGLSEEDARAPARRAFGNVTQAQERFYESHRWLWWDHLSQDIRFGLRILRKSSGFTTVAILTLALGIGANTAIFSIINGLLLRTLPVRNPGRLVELLHQYPGEPAFNGFSWDAYRTMRDGNHVFSDLIVDSLTFATVRADNLQPQSVFVGQVGGTFFQALGVQPSAGRLIGPEDVRMENPSPVAVISWSFWKSRFDQDPGIVGKKIVVGDTPLTIIGVTQRGFYGTSEHAKQDVWWPISLGPSSGMWYGLLGRLKPGVSIEQARAEMAVLFEEAVNRPDAGPFMRRMKFRMEPAATGVTTPLTQMLSTPLMVLMATVGLLLLLACANLAGLLLARAASRHHEMAVRACLGAARARLLRQTLTESLMLSLVGCAAGIFLAYFAAHALIRVFASGRFIVIAPVHFEALTKPDAHVLLFTGAIALLTGLLCGAIPAMSASNAAPASALQQASRIGESKSRRLFGKGLVASQVALSLVLVSLAGLFVGYLSHLRNFNLGFERNNLLLVTLDFANSGYNPAQFARLSEEIITELETIPGVKSATVS